MYIRKPRERSRAYALAINIAFLGLLQAVIVPASAALSLDEAIAIARRADPWLVGSQYRQQALEAQSTAASTLPDPVVNVGFANLPTDTFEFDQEPMTQFVVGLTQTIPRGRSTELSQQQLALLGSQQPHQRADRLARVAATVTRLWLDAYQASESVRLIEADRELFEHLVDVAQSSYALALGRTRQQDLIRAQLEISRLEDRLAMLQQRFDTASAKLQQWLRSGSVEDPADRAATTSRSLSLDSTLPDIPLRLPRPAEAGNLLLPDEIARHLVEHPAVRSIDARIDAADVSVELAQQQYRPEWKLNASYGYREDMPAGMDRSDFFSVGVAFDLPLFTTRRQDQQVRSAAASAAALRTERALALRNMVASVEEQQVRLLRLNQRRELYRSRLLAEIHQQAEASLTAYTNDDGDFSEAVRARIDELNARIDALDINIERLKTIAQLNYFFTRGEAGDLWEQSHAAAK